MQHFRLQLCYAYQHHDCERSEPIHSPAILSAVADIARVIGRSSGLEASTGSCNSKAGKEYDIKKSHFGEGLVVLRDVSWGENRQVEDILGLKYNFTSTEATIVMIYKFRNAQLPPMYIESLYKLGIS